VRNLGAAGLASTRNTAVGLLIRDAGFHFYGQVSTEIQRETDRAGLDLLITAGGDKEETQVEAVENLLGHSVGGIIVASGRVSSRAIEHSASFVPTITVALSSTHPGIDCIRIDPQSELDLARRIIDAGHRHVAITASRHPLATTLHARTATFLTEFVVTGLLLGFDPAELGPYLARVVPIALSVWVVEVFVMWVGTIANSFAAIMSILLLTTIGGFVLSLAAPPVAGLYPLSLITSAFASRQPDSIASVGSMLVTGSIAAVWVVFWASALLRRIARNP